MTTKNCCGSPETMSSESCGCYEGVERLTPRSTANRPGLSELAYRIGTHAEFLETMKARLSSCDFQELKELTTRDSSDPSLALLDAWAAVADVLTFYQERIANEGYLRTADERRSILELGRLVGYKVRPGVSASSFLAYTIDENSKEEVTIPAGSRVQSIPGPDELPQTFESSEDLKARSGWNNLRPRMTQPQTAEKIKDKKQIYLKGIATNLKPNDRLLIDFNADNDSDLVSKQLCRVTEVMSDAAADRTLVLLEDSANENTILNIDFSEIIRSLTKRSSLQPRNSFRMKRIVGEQFAEKSGSGYRALESAVPALRGRLTAAAKNVNLTKEGSASEKKVKIYALRKKAAPFGHNAPLQPVHLDEEHKVMSYSEWNINNPFGTSEPKSSFSFYVDSYTVSFENTSTGMINSVEWSFGDLNGTISNFYNPPDFKYSAADTYTVKLLVKGPGGEHTVTKPVKVPWDNIQ